MVSRRDLISYVPPLPDRVDLRPGVINGPDAVTPILMALYNDDPEEMKPLLGSMDRKSSINGAVWADKTIVAQMVKAYNAKNGSLGIISDATLAMVSNWCSWASRRLGISRSQLLAKAQHAMLAAQGGTPDPNPAE